MLPEATSLRGPLSCLNEARYGIVWGAAGAARACLESALDYSKERIAFGRPIAATQIQQQKLANMALEVNRSILLALHLGRLKDEGRLAPEQVSMGKLGNVNAALDVARTARQVLGANGITLEYPVIRHMNNLESSSPTRDRRHSRAGRRRGADRHPGVSLTTPGPRHGSSSVSAGGGAGALRRLARAAPVEAGVPRAGFVP